LAFGTGPGLEEEIRSLLQSRLRLLSVIGIFFFLTFAILLQATPAYWRLSDSLGRILLIVTTVTWLGCGAAVWMPRAVSLKRLRFIELLVFGISLTYFAKFRYTGLIRGMEQAWEATGNRAFFATQFGMATNTLWCYLIVCYGVLIPNTWRRCVVVVAAMVLGSLAILLLAGLRNEAVGEHLPMLMAYTSLGLIVSAALAVFGSFKISTAEQKAFAARKLGEYRLKERLGSGGMGEVYLAEHALLKRPCAVKVIRPGRTADSQVLRRFEREVTVMAQLRHANTAEIYDYGHADDGTFYYVMEYLPGLNLDELITRHGPQPAARVIFFLRQLCGALAEAHGIGFVHRDLKPSNVIVCKHRGLHAMVKLLDFGLVCSLERPQSEGTQLTHEGVILGTPEYMSPEQARGAAMVDTRSDLYSLGILAYFLLTGRPPFVGSTLTTLIAHLNDPMPPLSDRRPQVPADLAAVVERCLAKDPCERFADAEHLDAALAACASAAQWTETEEEAWWIARDEIDPGRASRLDR
jgi:serine/threonine-protein kinase